MKKKKKINKIKDEKWQEQSNAKKKIKLRDVKKERKPKCEGKQINIKRKIKEYKEKSLNEKEKKQKR